MRALAAAAAASAPPPRRFVCELEMGTMVVRVHPTAVQGPAPAAPARAFLQGYKRCGDNSSDFGEQTTGSSRAENELETELV